MNSKKGKFEFIDFKTSNGNDVPRTKCYQMELNKEIKITDQKIKNQQHVTDQSLNNQIRISPFDLKQKMPFCYANYSMMNNPQSWMNSDEDSFKNKVNESMVSQMITVDCGSTTTTTQIASSTASSCSLPPVVNELGSDHKLHLTTNEFECLKTCSPTIKPTKSKSLLNVIDIQNHSSFNNAGVTGGGLAPLTLEWNNLSCEISTRKSFLNNIFNCFIASERSHNNYNNSESSSLNDLNREIESSPYQLERMFRDKKKGKKLILDKQSGQFKSGTINAIIGASGAGKSTLLECISGRRVHGVDGTINVYANTEIFDKNINLSYLGQQEALIDVLTVKEVLLFASRLKNYKKIKTYEQHLKLVNSIINEFKLECCANNYVHSISGGQLKRVAIASEIISGPDIIILDEPTSGLDSCTAYTCIKLLRKITGLVDHQQHYRAPIVICSIHQPSIQLLNEFHNLYVLSNNGRCIYQGSPQKMVKYLAKFNLKCPKYHDPVNYITELASGYYGFQVIDHLAEQERILQEQRTMDLQDNLFVKTNPFKNYNNYAADVIYEVIGNNGYCNNKLDHFVDSKLHSNSGGGGKKSSNLKSNQLNQFHHQLPEIKTIKISNIIHQMKSQSFPFVYHTLLLTKRTFFGTIREPRLTWLRVFQALFIGFLMSFLYDHPIGDKGGCWSEAQAVKEILNPINNLKTNNLNDDIKQMMNLTNFDSNNDSNIDKRLKKRNTNEHQSRIEEFLNQNKLNHELNSKASTSDNVAFVFFVTLFLVMSSMMPTVLTFPSEVRVLQAEKNNGYYSCGSYYLAKIIADTPFVIFNAILFCSIVYPLTGQLLELKIFYMFTFVAIVASLIAHCIGMLFGTIYVHSVTSAVFMAPLSMSPVFLFSGFFGKISSLPLFLKPVAYMSYVRYSFECFLISLYGFDRCKITHNRTFFLHRTLHNWTLFQREKDIFFNSVDAITTTLPNLSNLPTDPQALVQNSPFNFNSSTFKLLPETSRSILNSNLPNDLLKSLNFSSYTVDQNLMNRFQTNFLKNNQINNTSFNLHNLLTTDSTDQLNRSLIENTNLNDNYTNVSNLASDIVSTTMATTLSTLSTISTTLKESLSTKTIQYITDHNSLSDLLENNRNNFSKLTLATNSTIDNDQTTLSPINLFAIDSFDQIVLNENEINQRKFNDLTSSLVLEFYNINDDVFWKNIIYLTIIFLFLRVLAYVILVIKTNRFK